MCSAEQSQMPFHQNMALLHSGQPSILPGAATCLQGGSLYSHVPCKPPQERIPLPMYLPCTHRSTHFCPSVSPSLLLTRKTSPKVTQGEVSKAESSRTQCQPQDTEGLESSPVASNGWCVDRRNPEARECRKIKRSSNEGVFLLSFFFFLEAFTLRKEPTKTTWNFCIKKIRL